MPCSPPFRQLAVAVSLRERLRIASSILFCPGALNCLYALKKRKLRNKLILRNNWLFNGTVWSSEKQLFVRSDAELHVVWEFDLQVALGGVSVDRTPKIMI